MGQNYENYFENMGNLNKNNSKPKFKFHPSETNNGKGYKNNPIKTTNYNKYY